MLSKIRFFYIRNEKQFPVACVAYKVFNESEYVKVNPESICYAVATHNPKDVYDKKQAREIVTTRLQRTRHMRIVQVSNLDYPMDVIKKHISERSDLPTRITRAAKRQIEADRTAFEQFSK